jgi:hypothetical protein
MTQLRLPGFIDFNGEPATGRMPPVVRIHERELSTEQLGEVAHLFQLFTIAATVAATPHITQHRTLSDGSRVVMRSWNMQTVVDVWPTGGEERVIELGHGVVVKANWRTPALHMSYKREAPRDPEFKISAVQLSEGDAVYNHSTIDRGGGSDPWMFMPMVKLKARSSMWVYDPQQVPSESTAESMPVAVVSRTFGQPGVKVAYVYATENKIYHQDGSVILTMPDVESLYPLAGGDPIVYHPPMTNQFGDLLYLTQSRDKLTSNSLTPPRHRYLFSVQAYVPSGTDRYAPSGTRKNNDFNTPLSMTAIPVTAPTPPQPNPGDTSVMHLGNTGGGGGSDFGAIGSPAYPPPEPLHGWVVTMYTMTNETAYTVVENINNQTISTLTGAGAEQVVSNFLPLACSEGVAYVSLRNGLAYSEEYLLVTAHKRHTSVLGGAGLGESSEVIRQYKYKIDGTPHVSLDFGVRGTLKIFEAVSVDFVFEGKKNEKINTITNPYYSSDYRRDMGSGYWYYPGVGPPWDSMRGELNMLFGVEGNIYYTLYGFRAHAAVLANSINFDVYEPPRVDSQKDEGQPSANGSYEYVSRYIIDIDTRIGLCVFIKVAVSCGAVKYEQSTKSSAYMGEMVGSAGNYTVKVSIVASVGGVADETVTETLVDVHFSRGPIEWDVVSVPNVFYWPEMTNMSLFPINYRTPPKVSPTSEAFTQLYNLMKHQGVNPHMAGRDIPPPPPEAQLSEEGIEYSYIEGDNAKPHKKVPKGLLYGRSYTLQDFDDALWMLKLLKIEGINQVDGQTYHFIPGFAAELAKKRRFEVRDGMIEQWSDKIEPDKGTPMPAFVDRETSLYYV